MTSFLGSRTPDFRAGRRALVYANYWQRRGFFVNNKLLEREIFMRDSIPNKSSVLIVGCGTSYLPFALREKECSVTVSDIVPSVIELFTKEGFSGFVLDIEHINNTSIPAKYDVVIASEVLEHIRNPEHAIEILSKYTKRFLVSVPNSAFYRYRLHLMFSGRFFVQWANHPAEHLRYWSHSDFLEWLTAMDLSVKKIFSSNGLSCKGLCPFMKNLWPNLFGHQIVYDCKV